MGYFQVRYDSRVVNYDHRGFIRQATDVRASMCLFALILLNSLFESPISSLSFRPKMVSAP